MCGGAARRARGSIREKEKESTKFWNGGFVPLMAADDVISLASPRAASTSSTGGQAGHPQSEHDDGSIEQSVEQQSVEMEQVCDAWVCACVMGLEVNTLREKPSNACYVDARERREHAWPAGPQLGWLRGCARIGRSVECVCRP